MKGVIQIISIEPISKRLTPKSFHEPSCVFPILVLDLAELDEFEFD